MRLPAEKFLAERKVPETTALKALLCLTFSRGSVVHSHGPSPTRSPSVVHGLRT